MVTPEGIHEWAGLILNNIKSCKITINGTVQEYLPQSHTTQGGHIDIYFTLPQATEGEITQLHLISVNNTVLANRAQSITKRKGGGLYIRFSFGFVEIS